MTDAAPWTTNQNTEIINKFETNNCKIDAQGRKYLDFEVRSSDAKLMEIAIDADFTNFLKQGDIIRIYKDEVFKSISNGDGVLLETKKIF